MTRCRHHQTRSLRPGGARRDHRGREHRLGHGPDQFLHASEEVFLFRQARGDELERQAFRVPEPRGPLFAERRAHALELAARQAVRECEHGGAVDADGPRVALLDQRLQRLPLLVAPELGLLAAPDIGCGRLRRAPRLEHAALRRAAERNALHTAGRGRGSGRGARVEEHVDGPPPRGERFRGGDRAEYRVLGVLAHRHDPHVEAVLAHQRRQERVEPLAQPALLHRRELTQRAERTHRLRRRWRLPCGRVGGRGATAQRRQDRDSQLT